MKSPAIFSIPATVQINRLARQKAVGGIGERDGPMASGLGDVRVEPFITVHDAVDPVGVALVDECTGLRLGVATDLGRPTAQIRMALEACDFLILEANHDEVLLHTSGYPPSVRRRIASSHDSPLRQPPD